MKRIIKPIMYLIIFIILIFSGFFLFSWITAYRPSAITILSQNKNSQITEDSEVIELLTWNIGYAGLGEDMDFFYDGGKNVRTSCKQTLENLEAIKSFLASQEGLDFILIQEADKRARRSFNINIPDTLRELLPRYTHVYGKNYHVNFVPVPVSSPMGYVNSGIITISQKAPFISQRLSYPGGYPWPGAIFNLKRGIILSRFRMRGGKDLIVINTHNSAFDDGRLRKKQMGFLKEIMLREYKKGNYVVAGGDFNQCPPGFKPSFEENIFDSENLMQISENFLPDWHWLYDDSVPTNRRLKAAYHKSTTPTTVIDFFVVSPNIFPIAVKTVNLGFRNSDHNPVHIKIKLNGKESNSRPEKVN